MLHERHRRGEQFKRPKTYCFVEALPKNHYGKVLKRELRRRVGDDG